MEQGWEPGPWRGQLGAAVWQVADVVDGGGWGWGTGVEVMVKERLSMAVGWGCQTKRTPKGVA